MAGEKPRALVRSVPSSYPDCLREAPHPIDLELARRQHAGYVEAVRDAGFEVVVLPPLHDAPDSVFVEDPIVVLDEQALIARSGAASRRGEGESIAPHLDRFELVRMES